MAIIPPRSKEFIGCIYVDELNERYSSLITSQNKHDAQIQDIKPCVYAKQKNKIVDRSKNNEESSHNPGLYELQPKTIHPDKLKIPKNLLTMKSRGYENLQRRSNHPNTLKKEKVHSYSTYVNEQKNSDSTSDGENTSHDDSKNKISPLQQKKIQEIKQEEEFINNYRSQSKKNQARINFDKTNQLHFSSIGKQKQDNLKFYDELKREQQQIWIDKITRNTQLKDNLTNNKKGISQYFSSSTENLAIYENSPFVNKTTSTFHSNYINSSVVQNITSPISLTKSQSCTASKSMTNLQKIMAQMNNPKRDFFFTTCINFSQKKYNFVSKILQNVSSLKSLDEDSNIQSVSKQIQSNQSTNKNKSLKNLYRSKSVYTEEKETNETQLNQSDYTENYKIGEIKNHSQSCINLSSFQNQNNQFQSNKKQHPKILQQTQTQETLEDLDCDDDYSYSYNQQKSLNNFFTPNKIECAKDKLCEADNKILNNMKNIIQKYQQNNGEQMNVIQIEKDIAQIEIDEEKESKFKMTSSPFHLSGNKSMLQYLTKKKIPEFNNNSSMQNINQVSNQQHNIKLTHSKNYALLNSKIMEKLQQGVTDNQMLYQNTGVLRTKQSKTPSVKFGLSQDAQKKVNEFQMKLIQNIKC